MLSGSADYYLNGTNDQPGLLDIARQVQGNTDARAEEIRREYSGPKGGTGGPA